MAAEFSVMNTDRCPLCQVLFNETSVHVLMRSHKSPSLYSPKKPQAHLLLGKLLGAFYTVIMALGLQVDVQQHTQPLQLVGQELVAGSRATELLIAHIDLALHSLYGWEASTSAFPS